MPTAAKRRKKPGETLESAHPAEGPRAETFDELPLSPAIRKAIADAGFEAPTPIQAIAIPVMMEGRDLVGQAQTGTGKTAAFALPLIQLIDDTAADTQALVLAPTRELAVQVAGEIHNFAKHTNLRVVPVYGGQPIDRQFRALKAGAQIVVGTPGRILDHLRRGSLNLSAIRVCVLDEADEMLAMGFLEDMESILAELPELRQIALFSATMPPRIAQLAKKFLKNPAQVTVQAKKRTVETTNQTYYEVPPGKKLDALSRILDLETPGPTIIFCKTRKDTQEIADALRLRGYGAEALHGEMMQPERDRVMRRFREGQSDLLVATDVAARGLDIETVTHVINYDIPWDVEQYIHRVGRTGRAGRQGDAITLIEARERRQLRMIETMIGAKIQPARIPTAADIAARRREIFRDALRETLEQGEFDGHLATVEELCAEHDPAAVAGAALHMLWEMWVGDGKETEEEVAAYGEQPEAGMTRLFLGVGRKDGIRPGDIVGAIANEAGVSGNRIGAIDILDAIAFVEVPADSADTVLSALNRTKLRGRRVNASVARPLR